MNISYNATNTTFNVTSYVIEDIYGENMILIFVIIGFTLFCVYNVCSEIENEQRKDLENKAIRAQNRITIKTLS